MKQPAKITATAIKNTQTTIEAEMIKVVFRGITCTVSSVKSLIRKSRTHTIVNLLKLLDPSPVQYYTWRWLNGFCNEA